MKSLLILLIAIQMMFPATIFANNKSVSVDKIQQKINNLSNSLAKNGWKSSTIDRSDGKDEKRMINEDNGLGIKMISATSKSQRTLKVAVFKTGIDEKLFTLKNQVGYKRFTLNLAELRSKNGASKLRVDFDNRIETLESEIAYNLLKREESARTSSVLSKILNTIIPTANAFSLSNTAKCIVGVLISAVSTLYAIGLVGEIIRVARLPHMPTPSAKSILIGVGIIAVTLIADIAIVAKTVSVCRRD